MSMTSRALQVTVISAEDLRVNRHGTVRKNSFVTVRTDSDSLTTKIDTDGGSYPAWNEKLVVGLPAHATLLTAEVHCKTYSGNKVIGVARIPVSDFTGGYFPENHLHFLSYRLRDARGERNGIINLSVRVKGQENAVKAAAVCGAASCSEPWMPAPDDGKGSGGIVIGFPVYSRIL